MRGLFCKINFLNEKPKDIHFSANKFTYADFLCKEMGEGLASIGKRNEVNEEGPNEEWANDELTNEVRANEVWTNEVWTK